MKNKILRCLLCCIIAASMALSASAASLSDDNMTEDFSGDDMSASIDGTISPQNDEESQNNEALNTDNIDIADGPDFEYDEEKGYIVEFDMGTGEETYLPLLDESLVPMETMPNYGEAGNDILPAPRTVFDSNWKKITDYNTTKTFPYRAICMIDINFPSGYQSGTGVAVASGKILTAAHCLYNLKENHKGEKPTSIVLKFGRAGTSSYKEVTITDKTKMRVNSNWLSSTNNQDWDYDYGVIDVPTSVTDITGWFGYTATANTTTTYTVSGYPYVDKTIYDGKYLYTHSGKAT